MEAGITGGLLVWVWHQRGMNRGAYGRNEEK